MNLLAGGAASRSQSQLQAELDAAASPVCGTVALAQRELVRVGGPANGNQQLRVPPCVTLTTAGAPSVQQYAKMGRIIPAREASATGSTAARAPSSTSAKAPSCGAFGSTATASMAA